MTIFISESLPLQPAFLYGTYAPTASVGASSTAAGYDAVDVLQADENNGWKPDGTAPVTLTLDLASATLNDYLAIAGRSLGGATIALSGSSDNVDFSNVLAAPTMISAEGAVWVHYSAASFRYLRISISGHSSAFQIKHAAFGLLTPLPFLADGFCANPLQAEGQHLISSAGLFLGSTTQRVMKPFSLSFGKLTPVEEAAFSAWAAACIQTAQAFFFVPDTAQALCHFGSVDKKYLYEPSMKNSLITIPRIPFTSRAI